MKLPILLWFDLFDLSVHKILQHFTMFQKTESQLVF